MNYLAHIYLSGSDPDVQVGGLLGDFVKGPLKGELPASVERGVRLHRRIDTTTDAHPAFRDALAAMPRPWRRFGGILLDVYFDHLLASDWQHFHRQSLDAFCQEFYRHLAARDEMLPPGARRFCDIAPRVRWLQSYAEPDNIPRMLDNIGQRLRQPMPLGEAWPYLDDQRASLETCFAQLMAEHEVLSRRFLADGER
ncbi:MAG: ACP phosphodiesterase [Porticoccaceae bacterium]